MHFKFKVIGFHPHISFLDQEACKCQIFSKCAWSNNTVSQLNILDPKNPIHKALSLKFRNQICDFKTRSVWCCKNGDPANESELRMQSSK